MDYKLSETSINVLRTAKEHPGVTVGDIALAVHRARTVVYHHIDILVATGTIKKCVDCNGVITIFCVNDTPT